MPVTYAIVYTDDAGQDLEDIYDYVAEHDGFARADGLLEHLIETVARLATHPERGNVPKELRALGITDFRELHYKPYRIIYEVDGDRAVVHGILDGRRDMQTLLQQRLTR